MSPPQATVGVEVAITVSGEDDGMSCGLFVEYPNSVESRDTIRLGDQDRKFPWTFHRVFSKPGTYQVRAYGSRIGLTFGCLGEARTTLLINEPPQAAPAEPAPPPQQPQVSEFDRLQQAASGGDPEAMFNLGNVVAKQGNNVEAVRWFRSAMERGHVRATNTLGFMYEEGRGVPQNFDQASSLYLQAIKHGNPDAMVNRGVMYAEGHGLTKDPLQAYVHFLLAAAYAQDNDTRSVAIKLRDQIAATLSKQQITRGQAMADKFAKGEIK